MSQTPEFNDLFAEDTPLGNDGDISGVAQPISEAELDDLLYSEKWSVAERTNRLQTLRTNLMEMEDADIDRTDLEAMLTRIDDALLKLLGEGTESDPTSADHDPSAYRETMSPDDDDLLDLEAAEDLEEKEEDDLDRVLDEPEWEDGDGFDPEKGVR